MGGSTSVITTVRGRGRRACWSTFGASLSYGRACPEGQGEKGERKESNKITMKPVQKAEGAV